MMVLSLRMVWSSAAEADRRLIACRLPVRNESLENG